MSIRTITYKMRVRKNTYKHGGLMVEGLDRFDCRLEEFW
jgi:hypothetical protein